MSSYTQSSILALHSPKSASHFKAIKRSYKDSSITIQFYHVIEHKNPFKMARTLTLQQSTQNHKTQKIKYSFNCFVIFSRHPLPTDVAFANILQQVYPTVVECKLDAYVACVCCQLNYTNISLMFIGNDPHTNDSGNDWI